MEKCMVRPYKHFDLERKGTKQAEARLSQRLQTLEGICLYHLKLLSREQRQLQKDLQRLQQDITKKRFSSYFGNGIQKPEDVFMFSPPGRQKHRVSEPNIRMSHIRKEKLQAQDKDSAHLPKSTDPNRNTSALHPDHGVSINTTEHGPGPSPASGNTTAHVDENRSTDASIKPSAGNAGKQIPPDCKEWVGSSEGESTKPTFLELLAKAKNAHYLRHRVPPESERMLSIGEIFGHGETSWFSAGKDRDNRVLSKIPLP